MHRLWTLFAGIMFACLALSSRSADVPAWRMVWSDEFNQADGTGPNIFNWTVETGGNGWGNSELETYTNRRNNSRIESGCLVIEALKENFTGTDNINRNYTSARMKTQGRQSWTYARIEARIKVPRGQGLWPAFWTLGESITTVPWPGCGEIDIMENIGREPNIIHGSAHGPGYSGGSAMSNTSVIPAGQAFGDNFHLFAIEWETNRVRWFRDNIQFYEITPTSLPAGKEWVFDQAQFIILDLAVGGTFPGSPDATTVFPQRMTVDYVRAYSRTTAPTASLSIQPSGAAFTASWSAQFPHVRLQRASTVTGAWVDQLLTGAIVSGNFVEPITAGYYRLRWQ